ncbi:glycoside hydrolase family 79 protein [Mycena rebaudengoi]|nr:glycoside hydrolase family 79 protein [Mycena rebaudengoi]
MYTLISLPLLVLLQSYIGPSNAAVEVAVPATPATSHVVHSNFYVGNDTSTLNPVMTNYLATIKARMGNNPVRLRIGGNAVDSSPYLTQESSPMIQLEGGEHNANDQSAIYNSMLWKVMAQVSKNMGGASYVIGLPLVTPPNATIATDARTILGDTLDAMLLGNEPDLFTGHGRRPNLKNYTTQDYFGDYDGAIQLNNGFNGDIIGGPSICCNWDLASLLQDGYTTKFKSVLKYISLQHYPQNNCKINGATFPFQLPYYLQHSNVVTLGQWQKPGIDLLLSQSDQPELMMSEFNSASCGGVPFSNSFAVGSIWSVDYALQLASIGYTSAFIHTREPGIPYNVLEPPVGPPGTAGAWTTNSPYYSLLAVAEALVTDHGAIVSDLDLGGSKTNDKATNSAYAIYNAGNKTVSRLVIFNYGTTPTDFSLPSSVFTSSTALRLLLISWGGETWGPGVTDGKTPASPSWATPNKQLTSCSSGCSFTVPGTSVSVVFLDNAQFTTIAPPTTNTNNPNSNNTSPDPGPKGQGGAMAWNAPLATVISALLTIAVCLLQ